MPDQDAGQGGVSNPIQLQKYLSGIDYPANKETLVARAQEEGANERVMETLRNLPMDTFNSPNDVSEAFGKMN